jgi:hypothetical protein
MYCSSLDTVRAGQASGKKEQDIPLAFGRGEDAVEATEARRPSGGGVVLFEGEPLDMEMPGPLVPGRSGEGEGCVNVRLLEAVDGRSLMIVLLLYIELEGGPQIYSPPSAALPGGELLIMRTRQFRGAKMDTGISAADSCPPARPHNTENGGFFFAAREESR